MRHALRLHPESRCDAVSAVAVDVARPAPTSLALRFFLTGAMSDLALPPVALSTRADELWRHTCFEVFLRPATSAGYYEFNLAPSTQWAAYRFSDYRTGMSVANEAAAPRIDTHGTVASYELRAHLDLGRLVDPAPGAPWRLGLSAVVEEATGRKSYWALAHPPGKPDFHHPDCFALELQRA
jgi:hypothetical protein